MASCISSVTNIFTDLDAEQKLPTKPEHVDDHEVFSENRDKVSNMYKSAEAYSYVISQPVISCSGN